MSIVQQRETEITRLPKEFIDRLTRPFARSLREWINDGLMTLFFFLVALELKRELTLLPGQPGEVGWVI